MWSSSELKKNAKRILKSNYWKLLICSWVLAFATASGSSGGSGYAGRDYNTQDENITYDEFVEDINSPTGFDSDDVAVMAVVGTTVAVVVLIVMAVAYVLKFFLLNPLAVGAQKVFALSTYMDPELNEMGAGFKGNYKNVVKIMFLRDLKIFLWSLLFIIPGIIKCYEYRMIPFILAENPNIDKNEAFGMTKSMMDDDKFNAFVLDLSFIGWYILGLLSCGIVIAFYVLPYKALTNAELFVVLKQKIGSPMRFDNPIQNGQTPYNQQAYNQTTYGQQPYGQSPYDNNNFQN